MTIPYPIFSSTSWAPWYYNYPREGYIIRHLVFFLVAYTTQNNTIEPQTRTQQQQQSKAKKVGQTKKQTKKKLAWSTFPFYKKEESTVVRVYPNHSTCTSRTHLHPLVPLLEILPPTFDSSTWKCHIIHFLCSSLPTQSFPFIVWPTKRRMAHKNYIYRHGCRMGWLWVFCGLKREREKDKEGVGDWCWLGKSMVMVRLGLSEEGQRLVRRCRKREREQERNRKREKGSAYSRIATIRRTWRDMAHAWRPYVFLCTWTWAWARSDAICQSVHSIL